MSTQTFLTLVFNYNRNSYYYFFVNFSRAFTRFSFCLHIIIIYLPILQTIQNGGQKKIGRAKVRLCSVQIGMDTLGEFFFFGMMT